MSSRRNWVAAIMGAGCLLQLVVIHPRSPASLTGSFVWGAWLLAIAAGWRGELRFIYPSLAVLGVAWFALGAVSPSRAGVLQVLIVLIGVIGTLTAIGAFRRWHWNARLESWFLRTGLKADQDGGSAGIPR